VAALALFEAATQEFARTEPGQAGALAAEMSMVRISHVDREPSQSVRAAASRGCGAGLSQGQESLESQCSLEGLRADAHQVEAPPLELGGGDRQMLGNCADLDWVPRHQP
jgi:hypothetical protein